MTNSNTSHTQKILLTTLTLLFLIGLGAAQSVDQFSTSFVGDGTTTSEDLNIDTYTVTDSGATFDQIRITASGSDVAFNSPSGDADISSLNIDGSDVTSSISSVSHGTDSNELVITFTGDQTATAGGDGITLTTTNSLVSIADSSYGSADVSAQLETSSDDSLVGSTDITSADALSYDTTAQVTGITADDISFVQGEDETLSVTVDHDDAPSGVSIEVVDTSIDSPTGSDSVASLTESSPSGKSTTFNDAVSLSEGTTYDVYSAAEKGTAESESLSSWTEASADSFTVQQTGLITGTVDDSDGNQVSSGTATLYSDSDLNSELGSDSLSDGSYTFNSLTAGDTYYVEVTGVTNHADADKSQSITAGTQSTVDFTLDREATFDVSISGNTDDTVDQRGELTVEAQVTNNGDLSGTKDVSLEFPEGTTVSTKNGVSLDAGSSTTKTFTISGDSTQVASGPQKAKVVTEDDTDTNSVTVNPVLDSYSVSVASSPINQGEALQIDITNAQDKNTDSFTGTADLTIDNIDGQDPSKNSVDFTSGSANGVEILSASETESVSSGDYNSLTVSAQDAEDNFGTTVNPVLDTVQVDQDSVEVGQDSALTVDLSGAEDLAGEAFTESATVNFDTSNFGGTANDASASPSVTFDDSGASTSSVEVLSQSDTQIQAESEVNVDAGTSLGSGDSFTANITQVAETITAESNTTSSDEAVANGDEEVKFTVSVDDYNGDPVEGATVSVDDSPSDLSDLDGIASDSTAQTDSNGEATFTATSTNSGDHIVQFSASAGDATSATATTHFKPGATDYLEITTTPDGASEAGSESTEFVVTRYDANDNAVTSGSLTVDLSTDSTGENAEFRDSGSSSLSGTVDITDRSSTASFYYYDEEAGDHSLTVNESDITADSVTHTVEPAAHTGYSVEPAAPTQEAGTPFEVEVKAIDDYSNTVTSIDDTLNGYTFTYSDPSDAPSGTPTYPSDLSFTDGVATGSVTLVAAEDTTLSLNDGEGNSGMSSTITVESASADSVSVNTEPTDSPAGSSISGVPTAKVTDEFDNPVEGVDVSVAEASGYEFDAGTATVSTGSDGTALFDNLEINTADTGYQLNFSIDSSADNVVDSPSTQLVQSSEFEVSPASASDVVNLNVGHDAAGVVDDEHLPVSGTVVDEFGNKLDTPQDLDVHIRETTFDVSKAGEFTAELDPTLVGDTETGSADVNVTLDGQSDVLASGEVNLVHEVAELSEGFNLGSVPQPASLDLEGVESVTAWNPSEGSYEAPSASEGEMLESVNDLHRGMYFEAANSDARVGYTFETDAETLSPGEVEMVNGWHLVGSNFDISEEASESEFSTGGERTLDTDLQGLQDISSDDGLTAYPEDLSGPITGMNVKAFDAYWVNVENPEYRNRAILTPNYIPGDRSSVLTS